MQTTSYSQWMPKKKCKDVEQLKIETNKENGSKPQQDEIRIKCRKTELEIVITYLNC